MGKTRIFISSTCYDLSQIRQDLKDSIAAMGHIPVMSEDKEFPVNPMASTVENCIEAVKKEADIFVLIIGNRYGYKLESGQSITNTEFLTAVLKGIPIYTFTQKSMIHVLPLWKKNPNADYSDYVDDTKVFEFIEDVRSKRGLWNFEFDNAQDIIDILKSQLSILFSESLSERLTLKASVDNEILSRLSGKALNLLLKKPESYEMRLFLQMMSDEIGKHAFEKNDVTYSVFIRKGEVLEDISSFTSWQSRKLGELRRAVEMLNNLFSAYEFYYGEPGVPSDIKGLYYVALRYGELYGYLLQWVIEVSSAEVCDDCKGLTEVFSRLPMSLISQLENYPGDAIAQVEQALSDVSSGKLKKGSHIDLTLKLSLDEDVQKRFYKELEKVKSRYTR